MSSESLDALRGELGREEQAYQAANNDFDAAAAAVLGINGTDLRCLEILLTRRSALPGELAGRLGLTTGSVTTMLDRLQRQGLATRTPDPGDRRKVVVRATPEAVERLMTDIYDPLIKEGFEQLAGFTAAELAIVLRFLRMNRQLHERHLARVRALKDWS